MNTMDHELVLSGLLGGALIGLAAGALLVFNGRIAGISGIYNGVIHDHVRGDTAWRLFFVAGLLAGGVILRLLYPQSLPFDYESAGGLAVVALGGLLVGFGTRLGSGCTSGHGVCGMSRLSRRSLLATPIFIAAGMLIVRLAAPILGG